MFRPNDNAALKRAVATCFAWALAVSAGSAVAANDSPARASENFKWSDGKQVYDKVCGYCHEGAAVGPVLLGRQLPAAYIGAIVRHGFRAMPAFPSSYIDDASLQKVGEYIATAPAEKQ